MGAKTGRYRPMPPPRVMVCDFLDASLPLPTVTVSRRMNLAEVAAAREAARPKPSWGAIFTKALAIVSAARPALREAAVEWPWLRLYRHPLPVAAVMVEADDAGETAILPALVISPHELPLHELDARFVAAKERPRDVKPYAMGRRVAALPRFLRRWAWWAALNLSGSKRAKFIGTYGVTSVARFGADSERPLSPWTALLHQGVIRPDGEAIVRLTYDHRVMDGTEPSLALLGLEEAVKGPILAELRAAAPAPASRAA